MTDVNKLTLSDDKLAKLCQSLGLSRSNLETFLRSNPDLSLDELEAMACMAEKQQSLNEHLVKTFEANMEVFKEHYPALYEQFKDYKPERSFEFFVSDDNIANIQFLDNNDIFYKSSRVEDICKAQYEEVKEKLDNVCLHYDLQVDKFGQIHLRYFNEAISIMNDNNVNGYTFKVTDTNFIPHLIMFGCGLGYPLDYIYNDFSVANLLVLEPTADVFYASLYTYDWKKLILDSKAQMRSIEFFVGRTDIYNEWYDYYREKGEFLAACRCTFVHYVNAQMQPLIDLYNEKFYIYTSALGIFDDNMFGMSHAAHNLKEHYPLAIYDSTVGDEYKHVPVFVVGNGPSIDNDIAFLRRYQDKAVIIACGSALDTLYNAGIQADIYVATERMGYISQTLEIFKDTGYLDNILCIGTNILHPSVLKHFKKVMLFDKAGEYFREGLVLNGCHSFKKWASLPYINPLVGNAGLATAVTLGFKQIYMFGMDNGKVINAKNEHSQYSDLYGKRYALNEKSPIAGKEIILKGNFGSDVVSNQLYKTATDTFERLMLSNADDKELVCYNCSDGALISKTVPMHSSDINLLHNDNIDKDKLIDHILKDMTFVVDMTQSDLTNVFHKEEYNKISSSIIRFFAQPCQNRFELIMLLSSISSVLNNLRLSLFTVISQTINSATQYFFILLTTVLCARGDDKEALPIANKILERYIYFLQDSQYVFDMLPDYLESDHVRMLGYRLGLDHDNSKAPENIKAFVLIDSDKLKNKKEAFKKRYE